MIDILGAPTKAQCKCKRCGGEMLPGKVIVETVGWVPDFIGGEVVTMSACVAGWLVDCLKCEKCGWSVST